MDSQTSLSNKQRLFVASSLVLGTILLSASGLSSRARSTQKEDSLPSVKSQTESLRFINIERADHWFTTRMQNTSRKAITAYAVAVCDVPEHSADFTTGSHPGIEPGEIVEITTPVRSVSDKCGSAMIQPTITILAVVFDDRSAEGELQWAEGILQERRGQKIQLKRINRLLRQAGNWPDADKLGAIEKLKVEIASLSIHDSEAPAVQLGLSQAKQTALIMLEEIEQWHNASSTMQWDRTRGMTTELAGITSLREGFDKLVRLNEKWIARY